MSEAASRKLAGAGPFSVFERMVAWRYLRSRRKDTVISVISLISFVGLLVKKTTIAAPPKSNDSLYCIPQTRFCEPTFLPLPSLIFHRPTV